MPSCINGKQNCRSFKISESEIGYSGGRYVASDKNTAAKRAGSKLFQKVMNDSKFSSFKNKSSLTFVLTETTQGSDHKSSSYKVVQHKLDEPIELKKGDTTIMVHYKYTVHSA